MNTLVKKLIENRLNEKIQKPDCSTRIGRTFLASYLQTCFRQIISHDKKVSSNLILDYNKNFLDNFSSRLINRPDEKILIALSGESASGKSTVCKQISNCIKELNLPITILTADNYFKDISELIKQYGNFDLLRDSGFDVDSPDNFNLDLLRNDIISLKNGNDILSPKYVVNGQGVSIPKCISVKSQKIIIVEGMCSIYDKVLDVFDIKIYVDVDENERKNRFIKRAKERNQDSENALKHWEYIQTAGREYVAKNKDKCDIIINGKSNLENLSYLVEYINLITNNFSC